jgi:hypothetical protein
MPIWATVGIVLCSCASHARGEEPWPHYRNLSDGTIEAKFQNGAICLKRPDYDRTIEARASISLKQIFATDDSLKIKRERASEIRPAFQELQAARFSVCFEYGSGSRTKQQYDDAVKVLDEIQRNILTQTPPPPPPPPGSLVETIRGEEQFSNAIRNPRGPVFIHFCAPQSAHCESFSDVRERLANKYMGENVRIFVLQTTEIEFAQLRQRTGGPHVVGDAFWGSCLAGACRFAGSLMSAKDLETSILTELKVWKQEHQ